MGELCEAFGACRERTQAAQVIAQAVYSIGEQELQAADEENSKAAHVAQVRADVSAALQEAMQAEEEVAADEEAKELIQEKYQYLKAKQAFLQLKDLVMELASWVVVPPQVMKVIAATAFMYGFPRERIYPKRKAGLNWEVLKTVLGKGLFDAVKATDVCGERKKLAHQQKLVSIKEMASPPDYDEEKARDVAPAFEVIFTLIQAACAYRTKHLSIIKADFTSRKEEAAENGDPFTETPLEDRDDDFLEL